jgi:glycosyltransferase involved in cell wall biosynthesis
MSVYNGAQYLSESVESVLSQKNIDFEFIIVNDGSTDESNRILDEYARIDNRIKLFSQENQGLTKALIRGCSEAKGTYIARHDAGDISLPDRLRLQRDALDTDPQLAFVSCWTEFHGPAGEFLFLSRGTGKAAEPAYILSLNEKKGTIDGPSHHGSVMFRSDAYREVGGYRKEFYFGQDWDLWYRLAMKGKFQMIPQILYRADVTPASISGIYREAQEKLAFFSYTALLKRIARRNDEDILRKAALIRPVADERTSQKAKAAWLYFIGECLRRNGDKRSLAYLKKSFRTNPLYARTWIRLVQAVFSRLLKGVSAESKV